MSQWYILYNGQQVGPMTKEQLLSYGLNPNSQVWTTGMPQWAPVYTIPELMSMINPAGVPRTTNPTPGGAGGYVPPYGGSVSGKDKTVAGILAILIGGLGIQYFYCGKVAGGLITILLSAVTCGLWSVLMLVQGILMLTMTQEEFDRKYVYSTSTLPLF